MSRSIMSQASNVPGVVEVPKPEIRRMKIRGVSDVKRNTVILEGQAGPMEYLIFHGDQLDEAKQFAGQFVDVEIDYSRGAPSISRWELAIGDPRAAVPITQETNLQRLERELAEERAKRKAESPAERLSDRSPDWQEDRRNLKPHLTPAEGISRPMSDMTALLVIANALDAIVRDLKAISNSVDTKPANHEPRLSTIIEYWPSMAEHELAAIYGCFLALCPKKG